MAAEVISREAPKARGPDISHNEGAHVIDALSHCEHGERRPDPGPGRQAVADWAQNPQTLDGPRPTRRDAGESQGQREDDGHESSGKNRQGEICAKTAPIKEESGAKTDWEAVISTWSPICNLCVNGTIRPPTLAPIQRCPTSE